MIRAIFRDGQIQPLDPLPSAWGDGQELQISESETDPMDDPEAIERWCRELESIGNRPDDPVEWERLESALAEADRLAKDQVRKEMGLE